MPTFADHFSGHAAAYARYRPRYPDALFAALAERCAARRLAWDCATGSGQAAVALAAHFEAVVATDASAEQVAQAEPHPCVTYRTAPAEASGLPDGSVDLVTVAQALHWFDVEAFYAEAQRVAAPGGLLAVWTYDLLHVDEALDAVLAAYHAHVAPYWPEERRHVAARYATLPFPFTPTPMPTIAMTAFWTFGDLLGYLGTWSAVRRYREAHSHDPRDGFSADLAAAWGSADEARVVRWPLHVQVGRLT